VLRVSPAGRHLAVAGNREHEIQIYDVASLLAGKNRPQVLSSGMQRPRQVVFGKQGERMGLLISASPPSGAANEPAEPIRLVFDFQGRRVATATDAWQAARADADGWVASAKTENGSQIVQVASSATGKSYATRLAAEERLTAYALLPPSKAESAPILAVATHELGQPKLRLYDARAGRPFRQYTGHTQPITSLAFSPDHRLLASVARDNTVRVWSLTDVRDTLGRRGQLAGIVLRDVVLRDGAARNGAGGAEVASVAPDSPAAGALREGDRIVRAGVGMAPAAIETARGLYDLFWESEPGTEARLVRLRDGATKTITIVVGQGVDERKPLFSLLLAPGDNEPGDKQDAARWIGWSPLGPFDASDVAMERLVGWQFNTGQANAPVAFAPLGEYRDQYYRRGLLATLVREGRLTAPKVSVAPPPAAIIPWIAGEQDSPTARSVEDGSRPIVIRRKGAAQLNIGVYGLDPSRVDSLKLEIDGQAVAVLRPTIDPDQWTGEISTRDWKPGGKLARVRITTDEPTPQTFVRDFELRYRPPPPEVAVGTPQPQGPTKLPEFAVHAVVSPQQGAAVVSLRHVHVAEDGKLVTVAKKTWNTDKKLELKEAVKLKPGRNLIYIEARNTETPAGDVQAETTRRQLVVDHRPEPAPPPQIILTRLAAGSATGDSAAAEAPYDPERAPVVADSQVRVSGRIVAQDILATVTILREGEDAPQPLRGFKPGVGRSFAFDQTVQLKPGAQEFTLVARTAKGSQQRLTFRVEHRPPPPEPAWLLPAGGLNLYAGQHEPKHEIKAAFLAAGHQTAGLDGLKPQILVNGKPVEAALAVKLPTEKVAQGEIRATVPLRPGPNRVQVVLTNRWGGRQASPPYTIYYRRPPRVVQVAEPKLGELPLATVVAEIESPTDLGLSGVMVNGQRLSPGAIRLVERKDGVARYRITASDVPLKRGPNTITVSPFNEDGVALEPGRIKVTYDPPPPPTARVTWIEPAGDATVAEPGLPVVVRVRSASRLRELVILRNGGVAGRVDVSSQRQVAGGDFELKHQMTLALEPGPNSLAARATNDGGAAIAEVTVSYAPRPVRIVIDRLEYPGSKEGLTPRANAAGNVQFPTASKMGRVWLHGRVIWQAGHGDRIDRLQGLRAWVNGFLQPPVELAGRSAGERERAFKAPLVLSRRKGNRVEIAAPGLPRDMASHLHLAIDCENPQDGKMLHLLIVGVGAKDKQELESRALRALRAERNRQGKITSTAFANIIAYPLHGFVNKERVSAGLHRIKRTIQLFAHQDPPNHVVMMYYEGSQLVNQEDRLYLKTSVGWDPNLDRAAISTDYLTAFFRNMGGAHVCLLDLAYTGGDQDLALASRHGGERLALLCYAWRNAPLVSTDKRLIAVLEKAVSRSGRLQAVDAALSEHSERLSQLIYDRSLPPSLAELEIGPP